MIFATKAHIRKENSGQNPIQSIFSITALSPSSSVIILMSKILLEITFILVHTYLIKVYVLFNICLLLFLVSSWELEMDPAVHLLIEVEFVLPPPSGKLSQPFSSLMMTVDFAGLPPSGNSFNLLHLWWWHWILQDYHLVANCFYLWFCRITWDFCIQDMPISRAPKKVRVQVWC